MDKKIIQEKSGFICNMGGVLYHSNRLLPGVK
jgi:NagD protein